MLTVDLTLPKIFQRPSPNYSPTLIQHNLLVLHIMEGNYEGSVNWLCQVSTKASAHLCMDEDGKEVSQLVPLQYKAWAQCAFNSQGISLEIPGFTHEGVPEARWDMAAKIFGWLSLAYDIPAVWAKEGQGRGICQHHDLGAAGGGHVDCCEVGSPQWLDFVKRVGTYKINFANCLTLPPFALHGLPNPHDIKWPPFGEPTPNHKGQDRSQNDNIAHDTSPGFPLGSVADLQWRLNKIGTSPKLTVDGFAGPKTREAVKNFQMTHGLFISGVINAQTWTKLLA